MTNRQYTWVQHRENFFSMARLDRFYCFKHHFSIFKGCRILPVGFTDHSMVSYNVFIANVKHKSTLRFFWKVFKTRKEDLTSLKQWWDCGKVEIKQLCQQYTLNVSQNITK